MTPTGYDLRYAVRSLRRNPGFAALAVVSLALGIGINTAIFSLVDQLLLWSIPAHEPQRLASLDSIYTRSYPFYRELRDRNQVFTGLLASSDPTISGMRPEGAQAVEVGQVCYISGNYFGTLGVGAAAGRVIDSDDAPVAVLSYRYWQRRFSGDLGVIGRKLAVNRYPFTIVGIAERGFDGIVNSPRADVFVPFGTYPLTMPGTARVWNSPSRFWLRSMGRLKPGVSMPQAEASLRVLWPQVKDAVASAIAKSGGRRRNFRADDLKLIPGVHGAFSAGKEMMDPLRALFLATGFVLLIACANVANLLLARAGGRRKEIAIRLSVGASRGRLMRQLFTESVLLAVIGGAVGLVCASWCLLGLARMHLVDPDLRFRLSLPVGAFAAGITLLTGILFGLAPAFRATGLRLAEAVKDGGSAGVGLSRLRLGKVLIAVQAALSLTLLAGAGLFIRTLRNLDSVDVGFQRANVVIVDIDPTRVGYDGHRLRTFYDELIARTRRIPGVRSAALSTMTPMGMFAMSASFSAESYEPKPGDRGEVYWNPVSSSYFTTLGIPMLLGRDFQQQDDPAVTPGTSELAAMGRVGGSSSEKSSNAARVCIINESLARQIYGTVSPLGRHISFEERYSPATAMEIIGVVKDIHHGSVKRSDQLGIIYTPSWGSGAGARWMGIRTAGDAAPVIAAIRRELRKMDSNVPVLRTRLLEEDVNSSLYRERLVAWLCSFFGAMALGLASVGLYGVMAHGVTQRTREVGIRMALGAQRTEVTRMILRESLVPVLAGMAAGIGGALALSCLVAGMLFGVRPYDPLSLAAAALAMLAVALLAAAVPARRASRVDPMSALRYE
jgi:predicted permease